MSSKLASLLVQDGHVPAGRMAEAFSRQVIYGGALDTTLLELGLVDEAVLVEYLGRTTGLPPRREPVLGGLLSPERLVPATLAQRIGAVPVELVGDGLRVLVREPLGAAELDELARSAGRRVEQAVVPELRLHEALERVYGLTVPVRFVTLAAKLRALPPRARSVVAATRPARGDATVSTPPPAESARDAAAPAPEPVAGPEDRTARVPVATVDEAADRTAPVVIVPDAPTERIVMASAAVIVEAAGPARADATIVDARPAPPVEPAASEGARVPDATPFAAGVDAAVAHDDARTTRYAVPDLPVADDDALTAAHARPVATAPVLPHDDAAFATHAVPVGAAAPVLPHDDAATAIHGVPVAATPTAGAAPTDAAALAPTAGAAPTDAPAPAPTAIAATTDAAAPAPTTAARPDEPGAPSLAVDDAPTAAIVREPAAPTAAVVREPAAPTPVAASPGSRAEHTGAVPHGPAEPLPLTDGAAAFEEAPDRDAIFEALCRLTRARFEYVAVFAVAGGQAQARMALADRWLDRAALAGVVVPLDAPSAVRTAVQGLAPYVGQLGQDATLALAMSRLGRKAPRWGMLLPIVLRERVVALVYADAGGRILKAERLVDLFQVASEASQAFQRIILRAKGLAAPSGEAPAVRSTPRPTPPLGMRLDEVTNAAGDSPLDAHVDTIAAEGEGAAAALEALLAAGEEGARALARRLPGPLRGRRATLVPATGIAPPLGQIGPLVAAVPRFGLLILPSLIARLGEATGDGAATLRAAIALALAERPVPEAAEALGALVYDGDAGVRRAALLALGRIGPSPEMRTLAESLRAELGGSDPTRQRLAAEALGELRDVPSVPRLIELVRHRDEMLAMSVRRALVVIAKQDFGASRWRWRTWWEQQRSTARSEWLLAGLEHPDRAVRQSASDELATIATEQHGYHATLSRPQREEARAKWARWFEAHERALAGD